jgi:hypothetical protein
VRGAEPGAPRRRRAASRRAAERGQPEPGLGLMRASSRAACAGRAAAARSSRTEPSRSCAAEAARSCTTRACRRATGRSRRDTRAPRPDHVHDEDEDRGPIT